MVLVPSGASELDEARSLLTTALIRLPRHRRRTQHELWAFTEKLLPDALEPEEEGPIVGIGSTVIDGEPQLVAFLRHEADIDGDHVAAMFGLPYRVFTIVSGPIRPAARPTQGGDSISGDGPGGDTGTLGCLVENPSSGDRFVIGCNHVLAGVNQSTVNQDTVRQPGTADGGDATDVLGTLVDYVPIKLGGYHTNDVDIALAELDDPNDVDPGVRTIGAITGVAAPLAFGDRVQKNGWTTGHTSGTYRYTLDYETDFDGVGKATFVKQYGIVGDDPSTGFAQRGDSGAAVLTEQGNELAGMVIGVADGLNLACVSSVDPILNAFGVEPVQ